MQAEKIKEFCYKARDKINDKIKNTKTSFTESKKSRTKLIMKIVAILLIASTILYIIGYVSQWLQNLITREDLRTELNDNFFHCIGEAFSGKPMTLFIWLVFILAISAIGFFLWSTRVDRVELKGEKDDRNFTYSELGDFGTNKRLSSEETMTKLNYYKPEEFGDCQEFILGEEIDTKRIITAKPISESYLNENIAIIGTPGTMKTRAVINNYMIQAIRQGRSLFCIDTKGSLYSDFYEYAKTKGYTQRVLNLVEIDKSDGFDPISVVRDDPDLIDVFAQVIIENTGDEKSVDRFFDSGEIALLKAITLLVTHDGGKDGFTYIKDEKERNFITIYKTIIMNKIEDIALTFEAIAQSDPMHPALYPWNLFVKGGKVSNNFIIGLGTRLQLLQNRRVQNLFSHNDIDVSLLGKQKCIYYLRIPDTNQTYNFISSLFITLIYVKLIAQADANDNLKLNVPVTALLDELCTTGKIPDFKQKISSVRSRGIATVLAIQNIPQIMEQYDGKKWEEILGDCDIKLFLGGNENTTAEYLSKESGTATIETKSDGYRYDTSLASPMMFNDSHSTNERNVYTPGETRTLDIWRELIFVRGMNVYCCQKFDYTKHPEYKNLKPSNITKHIPLYKRNDECEDKEAAENESPEKEPTSQPQKPTPKKQPNPKEQDKPKEQPKPRRRAAPKKLTEQKESNSEKPNLTPKNSDPPKQENTKTTDFGLMGFGKNSF